MSDKASELFWDAFMVSGHICIDCACRRTHFSRNKSAGDWNEGELEDLLKQEAEHPNRCLGTTDDSVATLFIQGNPYCYGCPCGTAAKYENFLIEEEPRIIEYYKLRAKAKQESAAKASSNLASLGVTS